MAFLDHSLLPALLPGMACSDTYVRAGQNGWFALCLMYAILKWKIQAIKSCLDLLVMVGDDCKPANFETYSIYWNNSSLSMITVQCLQYSVDILINDLDDRLLMLLFVHQWQL